MNIGQWPLRERPRERLSLHGAAALSDAELIALIVRTGIAGKSAVDIAREALARFGGLSRLLAAPPCRIVHGARPRSGALGRAGECGRARAAIAG